MFCAWGAAGSRQMYQVKAENATCAAGRVHVEVLGASWRWEYFIWERPEVLVAWVLVYNFDVCIRDRDSLLEEDLTEHVHVVVSGSVSWEGTRVVSKTAQLSYIISFTLARGCWSSCRCFEAMERVESSRSRSENGNQGPRGQRPSTLISILCGVLNWTPQTSVSRSLWTVEWKQWNWYWAARFCTCDGHALALVRYKDEVSTSSTLLYFLMKALLVLSFWTLLSFLGKLRWPTVQLWLADYDQLWYIA